MDYWGSWFGQNDVFHPIHLKSSKFNKIKVHPTAVRHFFCQKVFGIKMKGNGKAVRQEAGHKPEPERHLQMHDGKRILSGLREDTHRFRTGRQSGDCRI